MKEVEIGSIIFEEILNEDELSCKGDRFNPKGIGECKIMVYAGEGSIPHFHIKSVNNKSFDCCVCIYSNTFFNHSEYAHTDILNNKQCKALNDWLSKENKKIPGKTNWQAIAMTWEENNKKCPYPESEKVSKQPYYISMKNFRK